MGILKAELKKVSRMGWTYVTILGMNAFSAAMFALFLILYLKSTALDDAAEFTITMAKHAKGLLYFVFVTETWVFSFAGFFLMGILIGHLIGREFDEGSIGLLFLSPYPRLSVFGAKVAVVLIVYACALLLNLLIQGATVFLFSRVHEIFLRLVSLDVIFKLVAAHVLIDVSWLGLIFLLSTLSRGVASTLVYTLVVYFSLLFVDAVVYLGGKFQFLQAWVLTAGEYTFTNTCRILDSSRIGPYIMSGAIEFPLSFKLLGVNALYGLLFFGVAFLLFRAREV